MKRETDQGIGRWKVGLSRSDDTPQPLDLDHHRLLLLLLLSSSLLQIPKKLMDWVYLRFRSQTNAFFLCLSLFGLTKHCYSMPGAYNGMENVFIYFSGKSRIIINL